MSIFAWRNGTFIVSFYMTNIPKKPVIIIRKSEVKTNSIGRIANLFFIFAGILSKFKSYLLSKSVRMNEMTIVFNTSNARMPIKESPCGSEAFAMIELATSIGDQHDIPQISTT